jgi:hypothetical protein
LNSPNPPPLYEAVGHRPVALIAGTEPDVKTLLAYEPHTWTVSSASAGEQSTRNASAAMTLEARVSRRLRIKPHTTVAESGTDDYDIDVDGHVVAARIKG